MVNISKLLASSAFTGFKNYTTVSASGSLPASPIPPGSFISTIISMPLNNSNAISTAQINFATIETFSRQMFGYINTGVIGGNYSIQAQSYYSGGSLNVLVIEVNATGSTFTPPAQTINVSARLYKAPF